MSWHYAPGQYFQRDGVEANDNAMEVYYFFSGLSVPWATESIAALAGNMNIESTMNPLVRLFTTSGAFGLVQWITHKQTMSTWCANNGYDRDTGPGQCAYIEAERGGADDQWSRKSEWNNITFTQFAQNTPGYTVEQLAKCFNDCFEKPGSYNPQRARWAVYYYQMFTGSPPGPTPGNIDKWLLFKFRKDVKARAHRSFFV